ncbi:hypothetical protein [Streptomyces qinzhouensis]|nr:hypothetical protein [Streptomyces qinzhouensis]
MGEGFPLLLVGRFCNGTRPPVLPRPTRPSAELREEPAAFSFS